MARLTLIVCPHCGRVKGEAAGWDSSCGSHAVEVYADTVEREDGLVIRAEATGRELPLEERWSLTSG